MKPPSVTDMPQTFTFALVDVLSEDVKLSKGKARDREALREARLWGCL